MGQQGAATGLRTDCRFLARSPLGCGSLRKPEPWPRGNTVPRVSGWRVICRQCCECKFHANLGLNAGLGAGRRDVRNKNEQAVWCARPSESNRNHFQGTHSEHCSRAGVAACVPDAELEPSPRDGPGWLRSTGEKSCGIRVLGTTPVMPSESGSDSGSDSTASDGL